LARPSDGLFRVLPRTARESLVSRVTQRLAHVARRSGRRRARAYGRRHVNGCGLRMARMLSFSNASGSSPWISMLHFGKAGTKIESCQLEHSPAAQRLA
jgi:hypothetical protein